MAFGDMALNWVMDMVLIENFNLVVGWEWLWVAWVLVDWELVVLWLDLEVNM